MRLNHSLLHFIWPVYPHSLQERMVGMVCQIHGIQYRTSKPALFRTMRIFGNYLFCNFPNVLFGSRQDDRLSGLGIVVVPV